MKYVWFEGKTWLDTGRKDHRGDHLLVKWTDPSRGVLADPMKIRPVDHETREAIEYFIAKKKL